MIQQIRNLSNNTLLIKLTIDIESDHIAVEMIVGMAGILARMHSKSGTVDQQF